MACAAHRQGLRHALLLALEGRRIAAAAHGCRRQRQQQGQYRFQLRLQLWRLLGQWRQVLPDHRQSCGRATAAGQLVQEAAAVQSKRCCRVVWQEGWVGCLQFLQGLRSGRGQPSKLQLGKESKAANTAEWSEAESLHAQPSSFSASKGQMSTCASTEQVIRN